MAWTNLPLPWRARGRRRRIGGFGRGIAACTASAMVVALLAAGMQPAAGASSSPTPNRLRPIAKQKPVPVYPVPDRTVPVPAAKPWRRPPVTWPAPGTATAALTIADSIQPPATQPDDAAMAGVTPGSARAGSLPVWAGPAVRAWHASRAATTSATATVPTGTVTPAAVRVTMASRQAAAAAGISGVVFAIARSDGKPGAAQLHISLDYASFAYADGGGYAARLHLVELPGCALTTPSVAQCRAQTPVASADDVATDRLGANITVPAAGAASSAVAAPALVLAATTSVSGSAGDYSATPLTEAGSWAEGGASGSFTYSYPVNVPPVPGGLAPQVSLDYDSQAVDGLTSSTNDQASWIGDGWDYQPGYIEQDYQTCSAQTSLPSSEQTGDLCWSSSNRMTLTLNGQQTLLVDDPLTGWHAQADGGERISYQTGTVNGTHDGDYWVITDTDGTSYYFGLNELPGYAAGDATNSAWTVPVYATASGQPCYSATFAGSHCMQAWRWNLDYVTDSHGDAMAFFYNTQTNYYAADEATTATASYTQAGALAKIEYGLRAGSIFGVTPAAEVVFAVATDRTDIPTGSGSDLACSSGQACDVQSPTFWSRYRLSSITTESLHGSALEPVDAYALTQDYPDPNDATTTPSLWLESITRTGEDGTAASLPPVQFGPIPLANRVESAADLNDGYSIITRMRLKTITSETGGVITVTYDTPPSSCTSGNFPAPDANTTLCYPDYWSPPGAGGPVVDWFNKYVVTGVSAKNTVGGGVPFTATYCYGSEPGCLSGAAWHYNDNPLTKSQQRTWDQWRGFRTVISQTGTPPDPVTETEDVYFQGMNGDYQSNGSTTSASLTSTEGGDTVTDSSQYAGMDFQHIVYDGAGGGEVSDTVTVPWSSAVTATQAQPAPLPSLQAFLTGTGETRVFTPLTLGGTRESDTTYTHDSHGLVIAKSSVPDTSDPAEDTCTATTYADNTSTWLLDLPAEVTVTSVPCVAAVSLPGDAVSDERFYYDSSPTLAAAPSAGNPTMTQLATSYDGTTPVFTTESTATFDEYGRPLTTTDADNRTTRTSYTPASGAEPTSQTVTDPMNLVTATTYDPARDLTLSTTTPAGWETSETYDGLGRLTAVWKPGDPEGTVPADETFSYAVSDTAPSVVTTNMITDTGGYLPSETLYDSLGRPVETQAETPDGGRNITDTAFNSDGRPQLVSNSYYNQSAPDSKIVDSPPGEVPSQTGYVYDGAGRVIQQISYDLGTETWETDTAYGGDSTTVSYKAVTNSLNNLPQAGTRQTTFTNGVGKTSAIYQYHTGVPADPADPAADYDETTYAYTPAQQLASIDDAAGNQWSYAYNLAGNQVSATDPDAGTTTQAYDPAGQLLSSTDARGKTVSYTYDADGRKTAEYDTTDAAPEAGADELASWAYDTLAKGQLTSSTSYIGGTGGSAYTQGFLGYTSNGLPNGRYVKIPSSAGALAGTYKQGVTYTAFGDLMSSYTDQAAGGLAQETVDIGYDTANDPVALGNSATWPYVASLSYNEQGQPLEYALGTTNAPAYIYDSYNAETGWLTSSQVQTGSANATVDATTYSYDMAGDVLSEADTPADGPAQVQCFSYDYLQRLTTAWSHATSGCPAGPSQSAESGAAAPYWEQYSYNNENNLISQTSTPASGAATTTTFSYPAAGSSQPHAPATQQASGPSGTSTTSYAYNADGDIITATAPSSTQTLTWNDTGKLSSATTTGTNAGTTGYVYGANGDLLLQTDPGTVTLYLPDEQLVENTATGVVTGTRFYTINGTTIAARFTTYANGSYATDIDYLTGDKQGTGTLAIDYTTLNVTRRYFDPYGNPVGAEPSSWPGTRGFVGGTTDPATGYSSLGAREYNPATAAFISPDPLLNPYDPQDLNAYAYAADNPATNSDPSGAMYFPGDGRCGNTCDTGGNGGGGSSGSDSDSDNSDITSNPLLNAMYYLITHPKEIAGPPPPKSVVKKIKEILAAAAAGNLNCVAVGPVTGACKDERSLAAMLGNGHGEVPPWKAIVVAIAQLVALWAPSVSPQAPAPQQPQSQHAQPNHSQTDTEPHHNPDTGAEEGPGPEDPSPYTEASWMVVGDDLFVFNAYGQPLYRANVAQGSGGQQPEQQPFVPNKNEPGCCEEEEGGDGDPADPDPNLEDGL